MTSANLHVSADVPKMHAVTEIHLDVEAWMRGGKHLENTLPRSRPDEARYDAVHIDVVFC